jgi:hypothetical protein
MLKLFFVIAFLLPMVILGTSFDNVKTKIEEIENFDKAEFNLTTIISVLDFENDQMKEEKNELEQKIKILDEQRQNLITKTKEAKIEATLNQNETEIKEIMKNHMIQMQSIYTQQSKMLNRKQEIAYKRNQFGWRKISLNKEKNILGALKMKKQIEVTKFIKIAFKNLESKFQDAEFEEQKLKFLKGMIMISKNEIVKTKDIRVNANLMWKNKIDNESMHVGHEGNYINGKRYPSGNLEIINANFNCLRLKILTKEQ